MDQKGPNTTEALLDTLQQWWAIARGKTSEDVVPKRTFNVDDLAPPSALAASPLPGTTPAVVRQVTCSRVAR